MLYNALVATSDGYIRNFAGSAQLLGLPPTTGRAGFFHGVTEMATSPYDIQTWQDADEHERREACLAHLPMDGPVTVSDYLGEWPDIHGTLPFCLTTDQPDVEFVEQLLEHVDDTAKGLLKQRNDELALSLADKLEQIAAGIRGHLAARKAG